MKSLVASIFAAIAAFSAPSALAQEAPESDAPAEAQAPTPAPEPTPTPEVAAPRAIDHRVSMWRLELGYRGSFVSDAGYAPFSTNGSLSQTSLAASRTLFARGPFSFAPGIAWDHGGSTASARGDATSFGSDRFTVTLEGRAHFGHSGEWGYLFLRGAPGVAIQHVEVDDASSPAPFTQTSALFAVDASGGYAWPLWGWHNPSRIVRGWLQAEGGYGWVASDRLALAPNLPSGDSQLVAGTDLGSVSMSGGFLRVGVAMSF
jgi:hypothetical protein